MTSDPTHVSNVEGYTDCDYVLEEIAEERCRQVNEEGWSPDHDDEHGPFRLSDAAAAYAVYSGAQVAAEMAHKIWPFEKKWFKPDGRYPHRKNMVKAAALLVAEIERIDREKEFVDQEKKYKHENP